MIKSLRTEVFKGENLGLGGNLTFARGVGGDVGILPRGQNRKNTIPEGGDHRLMGGGRIDVQRYEFSRQKHSGSGREDWNK